MIVLERQELNLSTGRLSDVQMEDEEAEVVYQNNNNDNEKTEASSLPHSPPIKLHHTGTQEQLATYFTAMGMDREVRMLDLHPTRFLHEAAKFLGLQAPSFETLSTGRTGKQAAVSTVELNFNSKKYQGQ